MEGKHDFMKYFNDDTWIQRVAHLSDILDQLIKLSLKLQDNENWCYKVNL